MKTNNANKRIKQALALFLAISLVLSNIWTGWGTGDTYANGETWSAEQMGDSYDEESLYDSVSKLYTTDEGGLAAGEQEIWSKGSAGDISVEFDAPEYADDFGSAEVHVIVTPRDKYVKITGVRQAGYFGEDSMATASNAIATISDANYAVTASEYDFTVYSNKPAFIVYYTVEEDADGAALVQEETVAPTEQTTVEETTIAIEETTAVEETAAEETTLTDETATDETAGEIAVEETTVADTVAEETTAAPETEAETAVETAPETEAPVETEAVEETEAPAEQPTALRIMDNLLGVITAHAEETEVASTQEYVWVVADEDVTEIGAPAILPMSLEEPKGGINIENPEWDALDQDSDGNYEYSFYNGDCDTMFTMIYPNSLYIDKKVTLTFHVPYGMRINIGSLSSMVDGTKILSAENGGKDELDNMTLVIVVDGSKIVGAYDPSGTAEDNAAKSWFLQIPTVQRSLDLNNTQDYLENGFQKTGFYVEAVTEDGEVLADNYKYMAKPKTGVTPQITTVEHEHTTTNIAYWANGTDAMLSGNNVYGNDFIRFSLPTVASPDYNFVELKSFKLYKPDDRFELKSFDWGADGEVKLCNYYGTDFTEHTDEDGTYYLFTPLWSSGGINNMGFMDSANPTFGAKLQWKLTDDLEPNTRYAAPDIKYEIALAGGGTEIQTGYGTVYNTLATGTENRFVWSPHINYKLVNDTTTATYIPGIDYKDVSFVSIKNEDRFDNNTKTLVATVKGTATEQYVFPYELQPTHWEYVASRGYETINSVTYTVTKADGTTEDHTVTINKEYTLHGSFFSGSDGVEIDFTENLSTGDRVSKVVVEWGAIKANQDLYDLFDYHISNTHEDGTPFTGGELLRVEYSSTLNEDDNRTYDDAKVVAGVNAAYDTSKYLYLTCGNVSCPILDMDKPYGAGTGELLDGHEYNLGEICYKGLSQGRSSHSVDNPVIELNAKAHNIFGLDDPTSMISGNMTLTQNMSGWKMEYTLYHTDDGTTTAKTYNIPDLTGNTELTRADLGMSDSDRFTGSIKFSYDGTFTYKEYEEKKLAAHGGGTSNGTAGDNTPADTYDIAYLIRNIRMMAYTTALDGTELQTVAVMGNGALVDPDTSTNTTDCSTIKLAAVYTHTGACSDTEHVDGKNVTHGFRETPWTPVMRNRAYIVKQGRFSATVYSTVVQGGDVWCYPDLYLLSTVEGTLNGANSHMPAEVPDTMYIQLLDDQFSVKQDPNYPDTEIISGANNTKWVKISNIRAAYAPEVYAGGSNSFKPRFQVTLNTWLGADTTNLHHPFGKVYYDVTDLLSKYDGSPESGYTTITFDGAVADEYGLLGDGDTTTPRLWYGDLSDKTINVTANTSAGVNLIPAKSGVIYTSGQTSWVPREADHLEVKQTISSPNMEMDNYEVITYIPKKGDMTKYTIDTNEYEMENTYNLYLTGPASTTNSTGGSTPVYSYSKDGVNYVPETSIGADEWGDYRYIKTNVAIMYEYANIETSIPLKGDCKTEVGDISDYVSSKYSFDGMVDEEGNSRYMLSNMAEYTQTDYILKGWGGSIWYDSNEDGYKTGSEYPAGTDVTLNLYTPKTDLDLADGRHITANTLMSTTTVNSDGSYELRSVIDDEGQQFEIVMPNKNTVVTQKTSAAYEDDPSDIIRINNDSDIVRDLKLSHVDGTSIEEDHKVAVESIPGWTTNTLEGVGCGLVKLPTVIASVVSVHVGDTVGPNAAYARGYSTNPDNGNPAVTYIAGGDPSWMEVDASGNVTGYQTGMGQFDCLKTSNTLGDEVVYPMLYSVYCNVNYDVNGATSGTAPIDYGQYYPSENNEYLDFVTVMDSNGLTKTGYTFVGWNEDPDADTAQEDFHTGNRTEDVTLYAIWKINDYTVSFDMNQADTAPYDSIEVTYDTQINADADFPAEPSRYGYTFADWAYSDASNGATLSDADKMPANEISVKAQWTANTFNVNYDSNGGEGATMSDATFTYDATDNTVSANTYIAKPGYYFIGWNTDPAANTALFSDATGAAQTLTAAQVNALYDEFHGGDVTLYAIWVDAGAVITQDPPIKKIVSLKAGSADIASSEDTVYQFKMMPNPSDAPMPIAIEGVTTLAEDGSLIATIDEKTAGTYGVEFGLITYTEPGVYDYTLSEVAGTNTNFTYDTNSYTMHVIIEWEDAAKTILKKTVSYTKADGTIVDSMDFTNEYYRVTGGGNGGSSNGGGSSTVTTRPTGNTSVTGGGTVINPMNLPLGNMLLNGLPKTGEEWMQLMTWVLAFGTAISALVAWILIRKKNNR